MLHLSLPFVTASIMRNSSVRRRHNTNVRAARQGGYDTNLGGPLLIIGDTHFPFHCERWLDWTLDQIRRTKPAFVVQIGDLYDNYFLSRHPKHLTVMTPDEEAELGRSGAERMWQAVRKESPKNCTLYQIRGNHDDRDIKRILATAPELEPLVNMKSRFVFDGVRTVHDSFSELWLKDICLQHGYRKMGEHARYNQAPTVVGHLHRGDVRYYQNRKGVYWELNAGFGGDPESPVFRYRNQKDIHQWTRGLGLVDEDGPHFLLMPGQ